VSKALLSWIVAQGIGTVLIEPGKPWQNGVTESFNGKFRDECRLGLVWRGDEGCTSRPGARLPSSAGTHASRARPLIAKNVQTAIDIGGTT